MGAIYDVFQRALFASAINSLLRGITPDADALRQTKSDLRLF
jgi:hypothetical protein